MYERPSRKPLRYKGHDYRAPCTVHITICTHHRQPLFGTVSASGVLLNDAGEFVKQALIRLNAPDLGVAIDTHIVMPDHLHAIIILGTNPHGEIGPTISDLVRDFKTRIQKSWRTGMRSAGWPAYDIHLWQRSFNDKLIENQTHLENTRAYILDNPRRWLERASNTNPSPPDA